MVTFSLAATADGVRAALTGSGWHIDVSPSVRGGDEVLDIRKELPNWEATGEVEVAQPSIDVALFAATARDCGDT